MAPNIQAGSVIDAEGYDEAPGPRRPTASSLNLAAHCCYPWAPGVKWVDSSGPAARLGNAFHELAALAINKRIPRTAVLDVAGVAESHRLTDDQTETLARMVAGWREWWVFGGEPGIRAEIAYAYDPMKDTARELPSSGVHRDYSQALPTEFVGTADVARCPCRHR